MVFVASADGQRIECGQLAIGDGGRGQRSGSGSGWWGVRAGRGAFALRARAHSALLVTKTNPPTPDPPSRDQVSPPTAR